MVAMTKAKLCVRCQRTKPLGDFKAVKAMRDGHHSWCRVCCAEYDRKRSEARRKSTKLGRPPKLPVDNQLTCSTCKQIRPVDDFAKEKTPSGRRSRCKFCDSVKASEYHTQHRERRTASARAWNLANKEQYYTNKARNVRENIQERLRNRLRSRPASIFWKMKRKGRLAVRPASAVRDLGCTIGELMVHLESKFQPGMSWDNYGEWHIDHVVPLASFDLTDPEQCKRACHYTNLQPLWGLDNIAKGARSS